jgi:hypothetical protein
VARSEDTESWTRWTTWVSLCLAACGSPPPPAPVSTCPAPCRREPSPVAGLRVAVSERATTVCVSEGGCLGEPLGSIRTGPLQPPIRRVVSEALANAGLTLVAGEDRRALVAGVEWRGTDTLVLRLRDANGRALEQATYRRSLEPCRALAELTWETCWTANFEQMKRALAVSLEKSPTLTALALKAKEPGKTEAPRVASAEVPVVTAEPSPVMNERLSEQQLQETVGRYREAVQRSCWEPSFDAREPTAPSAARVATSITVSASGVVVGVTTSGDPPGYLRLSDCIAAQVRSWRFPAAQNASTVSIPFVFAGE